MDSNLDPLLTEDDNRPELPPEPHEDDAPYIPDDVIQWLDRVFPEPRHDPTIDQRQIDYDNGARSVVHYLRTKRQEQIR